jgi:hypothetical protein
MFINSRLFRRLTIVRGMKKLLVFVEKYFVRIVSLAALAVIVGLRAVHVL